eukprot:6822389-Lingulodinium_polyedra.AAC.1
MEETASSNAFLCARNCTGLSLSSNRNRQPLSIAISASWLAASCPQPAIWQPLAPANANNPNAP